MAVLGPTSLTGCNSIPDFIASGSLMLFQQTSSPTSWTKQTTHNDKSLRVVNGTASPGGTTAFSAVFASRSISGSVDSVVVTGSVGNTTLTTSEIPSHNHTAGSTLSPVITTPSGSSVRLTDAGGNATSSTGGGGAHNHPITLNSHSHTLSGSALDFDVQYVDIIIAAKD